MAFLATVTLYAQMRELKHISAFRTAATGLAPAWHFLDTEQRARHEAILAAGAGDPWDYRVLPAVAIEAVHRAPRPDVAGSLADGRRRSPGPRAPGWSASYAISSPACPQ